MPDMICLMPAVPMRKEPSSRTEMVSQLLYGDEVVVKDQYGEWAEVQCCYDNYTGWVNSKQLSYMMDNNGAKYVAPKPLQQLVDHGSPIWIAGGSVWHNDEKWDEPCQRSVVATALSYLGAPYLWGGRTALGIDCSGFMQVVFKICGRFIPRDASQQQEYCTPVSFRDVQQGDLAFFHNAEGRITHVGMVLTTNPLQIIHASGNVHTNRLDATGIMLQSDNGYSHLLHSIGRVPTTEQL